MMGREVRHLLPAMVLAVAFAAPAPAFAGFVKGYQDWSLYVSQSNKGKTCYIASVPTKMTGNYSNRGSAAVLVADLPITAPNIQVSVRPGYPYAKGSSVEMKIGSKTFSLFTEGDNAWARSSDDDKTIIAAMKAGADMTVRGTSKLKTYSLDTYSLMGFTAAYNAMLGECK